MSVSNERAVFAGGCFWGMQELFRHLPGVIGTQVGYAGGTTDNPTYDTVKLGNTGHAETLEVVYDPALISYRELLELFFQIHDPTTENRQGNDVGDQYRSVIFFTTAEQEHAAHATIRDVDASNLWPGKVVTQVLPFTNFWVAEPSHQDYLQHYPNGYTCHFPRPHWKLAKLQTSTPGDDERPGG